MSTAALFATQMLAAGAVTAALSIAFRRSYFKAGYRAGFADAFDERWGPHIHSTLNRMENDYREHVQDPRIQKRIADQKGLAIRIRLHDGPPPPPPHTKENPR